MYILFYNQRKQEIVDKEMETRDTETSCAMTLNHWIWPGALCFLFSKVHANAYHILRRRTLRELQFFEIMCSLAQRYP
jgi:hypothetical protein